MSGTTPECWNANIFPVRPRPHWISSKTRSAPRSRQMASRPFRNSGVAGRIPPSPCTGSIITAAVLSLTAAATAARSFRGTKRTPGTSGSKGSRYLAVHVVESAPMDRPWNECSKTTYSIRPCSLPIRRANFIAPSHASVPEFVKKTFEGKARRTSRSASALPGSVWKRLLAWMRVSACFLMAATIFRSP